MIKNNRKGFTLIELLAVIVILAIISVITVPMIMNVIDKAKLGALEDSAYGLVESANLWYAENVSNAVKDTKFTIENNKQTIDNTDITKLLSYKGTIDKGYVSILSTGKVAVCIDNNTKKVEKGYIDLKVTTSNGKCDGTFVNEVGSTDDSDVSISTIKELQNRISAVESDITDLNNSLMAPDYTNIFDVTFTIDKKFTAISNGYLLVSARGTAAGQTFVIRQNDFTILHSSIGGSNFIISHTVPMAKGDTIQLDGNYASIYTAKFVPSK